MYWHWYLVELWLCGQANDQAERTASPLKDTRERIRIHSKNINGICTEAVFFLHFDTSK